MKFKILKIVTLYLILHLYIFCGTQIIVGLVTKVSDGDTIEIFSKAEKKEYKIRLYGIDCPEKKQDFGTKAKEFTSSKVFGKDVKCEVYDVDRYGRSVGIVYFEKDISLNEELLKSGFAWHYKQFDKVMYEHYNKLESEAIRAKVGLWSDKKSVAPWDFRKTKK